MRGEVEAGIHTPDRNSITVAEAGKLWIARCEAEGLERTTLQNYRIVLRRHVGPRFGSMRLNQLASPDVEGWRDELLQSGTRSLARTAVAILKRLLVDAQRRGYVGHNVAAATRVSSRGREQERLEIGRDIPSRQEVNAILDAADRRWHPLLVTATFTGMRASELRGLFWKDVDLARGTVTIRQRANAFGEVGMPKSAAGRREIPLAPIVVATLRNWRLTSPFGSSPIVFCSYSPSHRGCVVGHTALCNAFRAAQWAAGTVDEAGRPKYRFHTLRHFFASSGIEAGFAPKRLQEIMGHASITMTFDTYGHLFPTPADDRDRLAVIERAVTQA